jgi:hypothetical protein
LPPAFCGFPLFGSFAHMRPNVAVSCAQLAQRICIELLTMSWLALPSDAYPRAGHPLGIVSRPSHRLDSLRTVEFHVTDGELPSFLIYSMHVGFVERNHCRECCQT